jgi:acyl carrier protein
MSLEDDVEQLLSDVLGVARCKVTSASDTSNLEGWDSVNHLGVVMELEERYGISFSPEEMTEIISVTAIVAAIRAKAGADGPDDTQRHSR